MGCSLQGTPDSRNFLRLDRNFVTFRIVKAAKTCFDIFICDRPAARGERQARGCTARIFSPDGSAQADRGKLAQTRTKTSESRHSLGARGSNAQGVCCEFQIFPGQPCRSCGQSAEAFGAHEAKAPDTVGFHAIIATATVVGFGLGFTGIDAIQTNRFKLPGTSS